MNQLTHGKKDDYITNSMPKKKKNKSYEIVIEKENDVNKVLAYKHLECVLKVFVLKVSGRFQNTLIKRCKTIHTTFHKL
jgi:hypothetical protein